MSDSTELLVILNDIQNGDIVMKLAKEICLRRALETTVISLTERVADLEMQMRHRTLRESLW